MVTAAVASLSALTLLCLFRDLPPPGWGVVGLLLLPPLLRLPRLAPLAAVPPLLFLGLLVADQRIQARLPESLAGVDLIVTGVVEETPLREERVARFSFRSEAMNREGITWPGGRLRLAWYRAPDLLPAAGERWRLRVRLKPPAGTLNPGGFDYERWLFRHGFVATGYVREGEGTRRLASAPPGWRRWRAGVLASVRRAVGDHPAAGVVEALTLGERGRITAAQWELFAVTGTTHLVAISGLHVGLVSGLLFLVTGRLWRTSARLCLWCPAPRAAAVAAVAGALAYAALAGFTIPTRRAALMVVVAMAAIATGRVVSPPSLLAVALLAVLATEPLAPLDPGFWLSFGAVAAILWALRGRLRPARGWRAALRVQLAVAVGLLPLTLWFFQRGAPISPLANLLAVPVVGLLVVPLLLSGLLTMAFLPAIAGTLILGGAEVMAILMRLLGWLGERAPEGWLQLQPSLWAVLAALSGSAILLGPMVRSLWPAALVLTLPLFLAGHDRPVAGTFRAAVLDVGQGLAVVVETARHLLVYDAGPRLSPRLDAGRNVVLPYLRWRGWRRVDTLVVSHEDNDHSGGAAALLDAMEVGRLLTGTPGGWLPGGMVCEKGDGWEWEGVRFQFLHPPPRATLSSANDRSCVLRVTASGGSLLLPGDIQGRGERMLLGEGGYLPRTEVVVSPHHGSATSSSPAWVGALRPGYVIHSTGYRNRWHFPRPEVSRRYREAGAQSWNTADQGMVLVEVKEAGVEVSGWRSRAARFWNRRPR